MTDAIRILVADDHRIVREGIVRILQDSPDCEVVAEAADGAEAVELAIALQPDIVVMDLTMPRLGGLDGLRRIHAQHPQVKVLILTVHEDEEYIVPIIKAGASGYLVKDSASIELTEAIRRIAGGGVYFGPQATRILAEQHQRPVSQSLDPYGSLTDREREVFHLVVEGKTNKEIARVLGIAVKTVNNHRTNMMNKLDLHNAADIVRYAARKRLLPDAT